MNPAQHFSHYFHICPADRTGLLEQVSHIRYQVYCREFGYENDQDYQKQKGMDEYDAKSRHCLLIHRPSNRPIGSLRLIEADRSRPQLQLPFVRYCADALDRGRFDPDEFQPGQIVEFSRLAVASEFRRRGSDKGNEICLPLLTPAREDQRNGFPVVPVSLFLTALSMLLESEADYGVAMMEPKLMRLLRMYGINFELVGKAVQYHGCRAPYVIHRSNAIKHLKPDVSELFYEINKSWHRGDNSDRFYLSDETHVTAPTKPSGRPDH